jgi:hypothetical protein
MATAFLTRVKSKLTPASKPPVPVLDKDDEVFLDRVVSDPPAHGEPVDVPVEVQGGEIQTVPVVAEQSPLVPPPAEEGAPKSPVNAPQTYSKPATKGFLAFINSKTTELLRSKKGKGKQPNVCADRFSR